MIHKGLFFILKDVTVKYKELHSTKPPLISQRQAVQTVLCFSKRKNQIRKKKKRARSSALKKSHNTNTKFHYGEVTITSEDYKIFLSEITISKTILHISQYPVKAKTTRKRKRRKEGKRKRRREEERKRKKRRKRKEKKKRRKQYLKVFQSTPPPPNMFPSTVPSMGIAREQHNSHKEETREKHNSYKR